MQLFHVLVMAHIVTGTIGLVTLWVPLVLRKGTARHKAWGKVFAHALLATGCLAVGISLVTLRLPLETHPMFDDAALVRGLFGWMMLYLATLTIMLSRYGRLCIRNRRDHRANREPLNIALLIATLLTALNCAWQGWQLSQPLMMGIAVVGITMAVLSFRFIFTRVPPANEWLIQHTRGLVGAGISVYTAFFAFGAVNTFPALAFHPVLWATPTALGVSVLLYHQYRITLQRRRGARNRSDGMSGEYQI